MHIFPILLMRTDLASSLLINSVMICNRFSQKEFGTPFVEHAFNTGHDEFVKAIRVEAEHDQ